MSFYGNANETVWIKESRENEHGGHTQVSFPVVFSPGEQVAAAKEGRAKCEEIFADLKPYSKKETAGNCWQRWRAWFNKGGQK